MVKVRVQGLGFIWFRLGFFIRGLYIVEVRVQG